MTVHDALGQARRAGREDDPQGVVERHRYRFERGVARGGLLPPDCAGHFAGCESRDHDGRCERGHAGAQLLDLAGTRMLLAAEPVAVGGHQHRRFELSQAVQRGRRRIVLPARGPHGTDAHGREERDDRLRHVGQVADDTVSGPDAERAQGRGERPGLPHQLGPRHRLPVAGLALVHHGGPVGSGVAHHVVDVVEPGLREPDGPGHRVDGQSRPGIRPRADLEVLPHRLPERAHVVHRPLPQRPVVRERPPRAAFDPAREVGDAGAGDVLVGRHPLRPGTDGSFTGHKSPLPCPGDARAAHDLLRVP